MLGLLVMPQLAAKAIKLTAASHVISLNALT
jgi:hypothetical protein